MREECAVNNALLRIMTWSSTETRSTAKHNVPLGVAVGLNGECSWPPRRVAHQSSWTAIDPVLGQDGQIPIGAEAASGRHLCHPFCHCNGAVRKRQPWCRSERSGLSCAVSRRPGFLRRAQLHWPVHASLTWFASDVPADVRTAHDSARFASSRRVRARYLSIGRCRKQAPVDVAAP